MPPSSYKKWCDFTNDALLNSISHMPNFCIFRDYVTRQPCYGGLDTTTQIPVPVLPAFCLSNCRPDSSQWHKNFTFFLWIHFVIVRLANARFSGHNPNSSFTLVGCFSSGCNFSFIRSCGPVIWRILMSQYKNEIFFSRKWVLYWCLVV